MNRTEQDARDRLSDAMTGSIAPESTDTYLVALRARLVFWTAQVDAELALRIEARRRADRNQ